MWAAAGCSACLKKLSAEANKLGLQHSFDWSYILDQRLPTLGHNPNQGHPGRGGVYPLFHPSCLWGSLAATAPVILARPRFCWWCRGQGSDLDLGSQQRKAGSHCPRHGLACAVLMKREIVQWMLLLSLFLLLLILFQ